jgi:hypothetical protein
VGLPTLRQPPGLLAFFGVKTGGKLPDYPDLSSYGLTLDMLQWLCADPTAWSFWQEVVNVGIAFKGDKDAFPTLNSFGSIVPPGHTFVILDYSHRSAICATVGSFQTVPSVQWNIQTGYTPIGRPSDNPLIANDTTFSYKDPGVVIAPAGTKLGFSMTKNNQAAAVNVTSIIRYVDLAF